MSNSKSGALRRSMNFVRKIFLAEPPAGKPAPAAQPALAASAPPVFELVVRCSRGYNSWHSRSDQCTFWGQPKPVDAGAEARQPQPVDSTSSLTTTRSSSRLEISFLYRSPCIPTKVTEWPGNGDWFVLDKTCHGCSP